MRWKSALALIWAFIAVSCNKSRALPPMELPSSPTVNEDAEVDDRIVRLPPTWTPTASIPPTLTPTITQTPTLTPIPSITPTRDLTNSPLPSPLPGVALSSATLRLTDLPEGFIRIPLSDTYFDTFLMEDINIRFVAVSAFADEEAETMVMNMTFMFFSQTDIEAFDQSLTETSDEFLEGLPVFSEIDIVFNMQVLDDMQQVGDSSLAIRMTIEIEEESLGYDMLMFRRGLAGAIVMVMNMNNNEGAPSLEYLSNILDARIIQALQ